MLVSPFYILIDACSRSACSIAQTCHTFSSAAQVSLEHCKRLLMQIFDFRVDDKWAVQQAAHLLVEGFKEHWPDAWPDMDAATKEVQPTSSIKSKATP